MKRTAPMLAALLSVAFTPNHLHAATAPHQDQSTVLNAASAPVIGRGALPPDQSLATSYGAALAPIIGLDAGAANQSRATLSFGRKQAAYFCNRPLTREDPNITRAVIVIHGSSRNAAEYFESVVEAIPSSSNPAHDWRRKTIVLAPHFQEKDDARKDELWWEGDWSCGGEKKDVSSFAVVDALIGRLRSGTFPNLKWIVVTGHSAGGQFAQRYAAFTAIDLLPQPNAAFIKFVPSNPSSYVYLNDYRFDAAQKAWVIPRGKKNKDYDDYKYGLDDLDDYARERGPNWAQTYLPKRWVEVLAGKVDVVANSSFDDSREAMWQGDSRFQRALLFDAFMDRFYAPNRFTVTPVPNVGHDHRAIYASAEARKALYFED